MSLNGMTPEQNRQWIEQEERRHVCRDHTCLCEKNLDRTGHKGPLYRKHFDAPGPSLREMALDAVGKTQKKEGQPQ